MAYFISILFGVCKQFINFAPQYNCYDERDYAVDSTEQTTMNGDSIESSSGKTQAAEQMQGCLKVSKYDSDEVVPYTAVRDYRIIRQEEKVKRGGYTIIYNKEKVIESIL